MSWLDYMHSDLFFSELSGEVNYLYVILNKSMPELLMIEKQFTQTMKEEKALALKTTSSYHLLSSESLKENRWCWYS